MIHGDACFAYFNKIWGIPEAFSNRLAGSRRSGDCMAHLTGRPAGTPFCFREIPRNRQRDIQKSTPFIYHIGIIVLSYRHNIIPCITFVLNPPNPRW